MYRILSDILSIFTTTYSDFFIVLFHEESSLLWLV